MQRWVSPVGEAAQPEARQVQVKDASYPTGIGSWFTSLDSPFSSEWIETYFQNYFPLSISSRVIMRLLDRIFGDWRFPACAPLKTSHSRTRSAAPGGETTDKAEQEAAAGRVGSTAQDEATHGGADARWEIAAACFPMAIAFQVLTGKAMVDSDRNYTHPLASTSQIGRLSPMDAWSKRNPQLHFGWPNRGRLQSENLAYGFVSAFGNVLRSVAVDSEHQCPNVSSRHPIGCSRGSCPTIERGGNAANTRKPASVPDFPTVKGLPYTGQCGHEAVARCFSGRTTPHGQRHRQIARMKALF